MYKRCWNLQNKLPIGLKIYHAKDNSFQRLSLTVRRAISVTTVTRVAQTQGLQFEFSSMYACYGCLSRILCYPVRIRDCNDLILHPDNPDACKTVNEEASVRFLALIPRTVLPKVVFFPSPRNVLSLSSYLRARTT